MSFRGQHVLITGGSSGIGLALALRLAREGARLSLLARDPGKLDAAKNMLLGKVPGAQVALIPCDVTKQADVADSIAAAERANGPPDMLITSAGVARPGYFGELPIEVHEQTMAVNYFGTLYCVRAVTPGMVGRARGAIVMISSGAGLVGLFGYTAYSPSKFAVRGLAESLRGELAGTGVAVTLVYPPDTDTPQLAEENLTKPLETKAITAEGGLWTADEVARATLEGVRAGRFAVAPGFQLSALCWLHSLIAPLLRWRFDHLSAGAKKH